MKNKLLHHLTLSIIIISHHPLAYSYIKVPGFTQNGNWISNPAASLSVTDIPVDSEDISPYISKNKLITWKNQEKNTYIKHSIHSGYEFTKSSTVSLYIHSRVRTHSIINLVLTNKDTSYLRHPITIDWTGWKLFSLKIDDFISSKKGSINEVSSISFIAGGWNSAPSKTAELLISSIFIQDDKLKFDTNYEIERHGRTFGYKHTIKVTNLLNKSIKLDISKANSNSNDIIIKLDKKNLLLPAHETAFVTIETSFRPGTSSPQLTKHDVSIIFTVDNEYYASQSLQIINTITQTKSDYKTIFTINDIEKITNLSKRNKSVKHQINNVTYIADNIDNKFKDKYGMEHWTLPPKGGQWGMKYISDSGKKYNLEASSFDDFKWQHCLQKKGCIYNNTLDEIIFGKIHNDLAIQAFYQGLAYMFTKDLKYAENAKNILDKYIKKYLTYPLHGISEKVKYNQARIHSQNFEEARWLIYILFAYDLIYDSTILNDTFHKEIKNKLILPSINLMDTSGAPNQQAWNTAAKLNAGYILQDPLLINSSLYGKKGFLNLVKNNISEDGVWNEGSWSYFFYAVEPILYITESSYRNNINLYTQKIKALLSSPLDHIKPNGYLPNFGDTRENIKPEYYGYMFQILKKRFDIKINNKLLRKRKNDTLSLLWSYDIKPDGNDYILYSTQKKKIRNTSGISIIRRKGNKYLALKYASNGAHNHLDNLSFIYSKENKDYLIDSGTTLYGHELANKYYKETIAHNTIIINETSQKPESGILNSDFNTPLISFLSASSSKLYDNIVLNRKIIMLDDYFIDAFNSKSTNSNSNVIDLALHAPAITLNDSISTPPPLSKPYKYLETHYNSSTNSNINYTIKSVTSPINTSTDTKKLFGTTNGNQTTKIIKAAGPSERNIDPNDVLILRREAKDTTFYTLYQHENNSRTPYKLSVIEKTSSNLHDIVIIDNNDLRDIHFFRSNTKIMDGAYSFLRYDINSKLSKILLTSKGSLGYKSTSILAKNYGDYIIIDLDRRSKTINITTESKSENLELSLELNSNLQFKNLYIDNVKSKIKIEGKIKLIIK